MIIPVNINKGPASREKIKIGKVKPNQLLGNTGMITGVNLVTQTSL